MNMKKSVQLKCTYCLELDWIEQCFYVPANTV